jgi:hypothetical protein
MPEIPNVVSNEVVFSVWGNQIRDRTIQRYPSVSGRATEHPTPSDGDLSFIESSGQVDVYYSGAWRALTGDTHTSGTSRVGAIGTAVSSIADLTFNKPAYWNAYTMTAWATVHAARTSGATPAIDVFANIRIGGDNGLQFTGAIFAASVGASVTLGVQHRLTGRSDAALLIEVLSRRVGDPTAHQTTLNFTAFRTA